MSGIEDVENQRKDYRHPHSGHNPIPTISKYREEQQRREERYGVPEPEQEQTDERSRVEKLGDAYHAFTGQETESALAGSQTYPSVNKNLVQDEPEAEDHAGQSRSSTNHQPVQDQGSQDGFADTTQGNMYEPDPKKARKKMKKFNADGTKREVTDPITHLPVTIHDFTDQDLKSVETNNPPVGYEPNTRTGTDGIEKTEEQLKEEQKQSQDSHAGMQALFPPPDFDATRNEVTSVYTWAVTVGLGAIAVSLIITSTLFSPTRHTTGWTRSVFRIVEYASMVGVSAGIIIFMRQWTANRIKNVWDVEVWQAERRRGRKLAKSESAESAQWLNSLLASVWPLINPDLFTSIADTLEDVMQASLPSMVRMVAVEDLGQGSEALRVLGVRWLPTGAAARSVGPDGKLKTADEEKGDRTVQDNGEGDSPESSQDKMEAEEGDFVNIEVAFAYRPSTGRGIKSRAKRAHLLLAFYLPGKFKLPVWVQLSGFVGVVRLRLQLTPDPPFFSICTLSFLGQPKVTLGCVPLIKKGPNLMDVPLISSFVQSSIDAALAEYVAPKSLTLDLKDMMMGDDFKKDTLAQGVFAIRIKHAYDFKEGDPSLGPLKKGSSDPYVTVAWAKFGKPLWSTRVLQKNMEPFWDETCYVLVTSAELDVDEKLRIQLWDSDRATADDDLGRIELELKDLMKSKETNGKMCDRDDGFRSVKAGEPMPGKLIWSIGYFSKTRISDEQLTREEKDPNIKTIDQLKRKVYADAEKKLREASEDHQDEIEQQKAQDFKERQNQLIIASPPSQEYPSGILSIQIHQITGLELEIFNKTKANEKDGSGDEDDGGDTVPSAYCTIILNHKKIFKTRTKPKNAKPFFNAGCERFIADVRNTEVHIAVRDNRVHEDDPLLGIVYLPLEKIFHQRSQINSVFPLAGGVGYGRARISMVFRSVQLQIPREMQGWEYGTLDIRSGIKAIDLPKELQPLRLKVRTTLEKGRMHSRGRNGKVNQDDGQAIWTTRGDRPIRLPVRTRYSSPLIIEFRQDATLRDHTPAFGILWLKDIPDNEQTTVRLPIWKGDLKRAEHNILSSYGDQVGEIEVTMTFWSGLSGYHNTLAKGDKHLKQVMEVLDVCNDQEWSDWDSSSNHGDGAPNLQSVTSRSDSSSSDDSDDENDNPGFLKKHRKTDSKLSEDGRRSTMDALRDYKQHTKELHRKNRGIMQWKGPRTLAWMKHVGDRGKNKVSNLFHHHERSGGEIETEV